MSNDKPTEEATMLAASTLALHHSESHFGDTFCAGCSEDWPCISNQLATQLSAALVREQTAKAETVVQEVSVERMAHFLSEWLDDQAPLHERRVYRMVAEALMGKFAVTQRHEDGCKLHMFPSWPSEICTCIPPLPTPAEPEEP